jgi:hypothetical protein
MSEGTGQPPIQPYSEVHYDVRDQKATCYGIVADIPATPEGLSQSLTVKSLSAAVIAGLALIWKSDWAPLGDFTPHIETAVALLLYGLALWGRMRAEKPLKLGGAKRTKKTKGEK